MALEVAELESLVLTVDDVTEVDTVTVAVAGADETAAEDEVVPLFWLTATAYRVPSVAMRTDRISSNGLSSNTNPSPAEEIRNTRPGAPVPAIRFSSSSSAKESTWVVLVS